MSANDEKMSVFAEESIWLILKIGEFIVYTLCIVGVSEVHFCTTDSPQLFEFEVAAYIICRLCLKV